MPTKFASQIFECWVHGRFVTGFHLHFEHVWRFVSGFHWTADTKLGAYLAHNLASLCGLEDNHPAKNIPSFFFKIGKKYGLTSSLNYIWSDIWADLRSDVWKKVLIKKVFAPVALPPRASASTQWLDPIITRKEGVPQWYYFTTSISDWP